MSLKLCLSARCRLTCICRGMGRRAVALLTLCSSQLGLLLGSHTSSRRAKQQCQSQGLIGQRCPARHVPYNALTQAPIDGGCTEDAQQTAHQGAGHPDCSIAAVALLLKSEDISCLLQQKGFEPCPLNIQSALLIRRRGTRPLSADTPSF